MDLKEEKQKKSKYMGSSKDCDVRCIERRWTPCDHNKLDDSQTRYVTLKLLHWNILAQRLCDGFDLIDDDAPMLRFSNRIRLMKQHFEQMDADIMGLSEVDAITGRYPDAFLAL